MVSDTRVEVHLRLKLESIKDIQMGAKIVMRLATEMYIGGPSFFVSTVPGNIHRCSASVSRVQLGKVIGTRLR